MKDQLTNTAIVVASLLFSLVVAEGILRLHSPVGGTTTIIENDPLLGYHHRKNVTSDYLMSGKFVSIHINNVGLRQDDEIPEEKLPAELRVLVLGDSFAFGWGVEYAKSFVALLEDKAKHEYPDRRIRFMNAGHGGWGTQQMLAFLETRGFALRPDLVLTFMGPNDVEDNDAVPIYSLPPQGELSRVPEPPRKKNNRSLIANYIPGYEWLLFNSHLVQLARIPVISALNWKNKRLASLDGWWGHKKASTASPQAHEEKLTEALFKRMAEDCRENKVSLLISSVGQGMDRTAAFLKKAPHFFQNEHIDYIDVSSSLAEALSLPNSPLLQDRDTHYSELGNRKFAQLVWPRLKVRLDRLVSDHPLEKLSALTR